MGVEIRTFHIEGHSLQKELQELYNEGFEWVDSVALRTASYAILKRTTDTDPSANGPGA